MRINILCNFIVGGWKPTDIRLGGTEESIVEWAKELKKRGHQVTIYDNDTRDSYNGGGDICINIKSSEIDSKEPTLYLTNETDADQKDLSKYAGVIWPSNWAKDNIPVNNINKYILPHGYDPEKIYPTKKVPKQCFYASSPDRGLDTLLEVWPTVLGAHPDATLLVTYGGHVPGVMNLGEVDEDTMNDLYRTSDFWCHPASGGELYCMTGKKAQVAGCIPIIIPVMALNETVRRGFKAETAKDYAQTLIEALNTPEKFKDIMRQDVIKNANAVTWEQSTDQLLQIIETALQSKLDTL